MMPTLLPARYLNRHSFTYCLWSSIRLKYTLDNSLVPKVKEVDIEEKFVRGSGPGGSAVNTNSNCVVLTHKPTGIVIKCHSSRDLQSNRKTARELLVVKLDDIINGEKSLSAQKKFINKERNYKTNKKKEKLEKLKEAWKAREGVE